MEITAPITLHPIQITAPLTVGYGFAPTIALDTPPVNGSVGPSGVRFVGVEGPLDLLATAILVGAKTLYSLDGETNPPIPGELPICAYSDTLGRWFLSSMIDGELQPGSFNAEPGDEEFPWQATWPETFFDTPISVAELPGTNLGGTPGILGQFAAVNGVVTHQCTSTAPLTWSPTGSGGGGASDVADLTTQGLTATYLLRVAAGGGLEQQSPAQVRVGIGAAAISHPHVGADIEDAAIVPALGKVARWAGLASIAGNPGRTMGPIQFPPLASMNHYNGYPAFAGADTQGLYWVWWTDGEWIVGCELNDVYGINQYEWHLTSDAALPPASGYVGWDVSTTGSPTVTVLPGLSRALYQGTLAGTITIAPDTHWDYPSQSEITTHLTALGVGAKGLEVFQGPTVAAIKATLGIGASGDVQVFDYTWNGAVQTWTKPAGARVVEWIIISGGGGGGSGRRGALTSWRQGGSGGSGGGINTGKANASAFGETENVIVGGGGAGGAAISSNDTNGNNGTDGGQSSFGATLKSRYGNRGLAGTAAGASIAGGTATANGSWLFGTLAVLGAGGSSTISTGGTATAITNGTPSGGGGGGTANNTDVYYGGGPGGSIGASLIGLTNGGTAGVNQNGGAGAISPFFFSGTGGGGGAVYTSGTCRPGGNGGIYGGGGGGGSGSTNGDTGSNAGGNGADGIVIIISY
jgi:hypothetical protein